MMPNAAPETATRRDDTRARGSRRRRDRAFSTAILTVPNLTVFAILTLSVAAAAYLYGQGA